MTERTKFVLEWERRWNAGEGRVDVAELCRAFGVSRPTGYRWIARYQEAGHDVAALADRSRRPHTSPQAVSEEIRDRIVDLRKLHPRWGPRKLRAWLADHYPARYVPAPSTLAELLRRYGLCAPRRRARRRTPPATAPLAAATAPNAVWTIDFKGHFRTGDGYVCYPLTLCDAFSRYLLRCELVPDPDGRAVESVLDSAFQEFGRPLAMRSDNGPPFAAVGAGGLSKLAVWLLRLDIRVDRIRPGQPQENGRHERLHRTLQEETATPPKPTWREQQRAFDLFRHEYNEERPHEALGQKPPASVYTPSSRRYPCPLIHFDPAPLSEVRPVDHHGNIRWARRQVFISTALYGEKVELLPVDGIRWEVRFGFVTLGYLDDDHPARGLIVARRRRPRSCHCKV